MGFGVNLDVVITVSLDRRGSPLMSKIVWHNRQSKMYIKVSVAFTEVKG